MNRRRFYGWLADKLRDWSYRLDGKTGRYDMGPPNYYDENGIPVYIDKGTILEVMKNLRITDNHWWVIPNE